MTVKRKRQKPGDTHYVNNKEFTLELDTYSRNYRAALEADKTPPRMNNYLGESIMKMSTRLANSPRFNGYSYKEEMIHNGILAAVKYAHKFNGDRFDNGFAYITQIIFSHFIVTIKNEKKKYETNLKLIAAAEVGVMGNSEFSEVSSAHARSIADQKLKDLEESKLVSQTVRSKKGGFQLRTGYTKEERDNYKGGTPVKRD